VKVPAAHTAVGGVGDVDPAGHAYPALQLVHDVAPAVLNEPAGHIASEGVDELDAGGHA
jgi:hypothetical protein